jgi:hypothetical protein
VSLSSKSIHDLRVIAQTYDIPNIFAKDKTQLLQAIQLKQEGMIKAKTPEIPRPEYDARLMTKPPSKKSAENELLELLKPHTDIGLTIHFPEPERWHMLFKGREDSGTMRQPLLNILRCAERLMRG